MLPAKTIIKYKSMVVFPCNQVLGRKKGKRIMEDLLVIQSCHWENAANEGPCMKKTNQYKVEGELETRANIAC